MRRFLGTLLLLSVLVGCGDDEGTTADDPPADQPSSSGTAAPGLVQMIVLTSAGGKVSTQAYFVDDRDQMKAYVKTFDEPDDVIPPLQQAARDAEDREGRLAVATVAIGCDVPPGVSITEGEDGPEVVPAKVPDPLPECFAPMTSIAVVEIP